MSKKKGLSLEEKRTRMMELLFEKKDFFQLKDIEKLAPKEKGITPMSVKEVVQSLVDDGMIDTDRIGTSNYFWAYPSKALHTRKRKKQELVEQIEEYRKKVKTNTRLIQDANAGKEATEERSSILKGLEETQEEHRRLKTELEKLKECDPEVLEKIQKQNIIAKESANRWTDNVFAIKTWCNRKFNIESQIIDKHFGIPEDFDYL